MQFKQTVMIKINFIGRKRKMSKRNYAGKSKSSQKTYFLHKKDNLVLKWYYLHNFFLPGSNRILTIFYIMVVHSNVSNAETALLYS